MFEKVFIINLPFKKDRLDELLPKMPKSVNDYQIWPAVHGDTVRPPKNWHAGNGAWGCVLPGTKIQGNVNSLLRSWYSGEAVRIVSSSGDSISLTVNHPVLTNRGFVKAGEIKEGDDLVYYSRHAQTFSASNDVQNAPFVIEQVFDSLLYHGATTHCKRMTSFDFYGDGKFMDGYVQVVYADSFLSGARNARFQKSFKQLGFVRGRSHKQRLLSHRSTSKSCCGSPSFPDSDTDSIPLDLLSFKGATDYDALFRKKAPNPRARRIPFTRDLSRADSKILGEFCYRNPGEVQFNDVFLGGFADLPCIGLGDASCLDTVFTEHAFESCRAEESLVSELIHRLPTDVSFNKALKVSRFEYHGHVFDLQTENGFFVAGGESNRGFVISNCYRSHMQVLEYCMQNQIGSYLVLEDDAIFKPEFDQLLKDTMLHIPDDWQQLYLGGHLMHEIQNPPKKINDYIYMPYNVDRTHCFAVHSRGYQAMYDHLFSLPFDKGDHIDHRLGRLHETGKFAVYCSRRWIVGQNAGQSNIGKSMEEPVYWVDPESCARDHWILKTPVCVFLEASPQVAKELQLKGWHQGSWKNDHGLDRGVCESLSHFYPEIKLSEWYSWVQREAVRDNAVVPCLYHPRLNWELVSKFKFATWIHVKAETSADCQEILANSEVWKAASKDGNG